MTTSAQNQPRVSKSDEEWRAELSPEEYPVLRQAGTEGPVARGDVETQTQGGDNCRAFGAGQLL